MGVSSSVHIEIHLNFPELHWFYSLLRVLKGRIFQIPERRYIGVANGIRKIQGLGNFCSNLEISEAF